ncbi:MAG: HDOD domain-containing protein, partial [Mariprofundaceae bacterium]|nr:HDOD domain-containing protein [Mariprofundaceae bacterium]
MQKAVQSIPPIPEIWQEIQRILQQPDASAGDLGHCISRDPVLTAKVLKVCNSAAYSGRAAHTISDVPVAVARMGISEAAAIIFMSLVPELGGSSAARQEVRLIWMHSQIIGLLSGLLAEKAEQMERSGAALNGMLHDIGKLVMLHIEDAESLAQLKKAIEAGMTELQAEHEVFGYTHIDAGMMLA